MGSELLDFPAQAERTALAWQRTAIASMAVGALLIHAHADDHPWPEWPGLLLTAVSWLTVAVAVPLRYRQVLRTVRAGQTPVSSAIVPATTLALIVVNLGICAELFLV